jgi:hypothetical protein
MKTMKLACAFAGALALGGCLTGTKPTTTPEETNESRTYLLGTCPGESRPVARSAAVADYRAALERFYRFQSLQAKVIGLEDGLKGSNVNPNLFLLPMKDTVGKARRESAWDLASIVSSSSFSILPDATSAERARGAGLALIATSSALAAAEKSLADARRRTTPPLTDDELARLEKAVENSKQAVENSITALRRELPSDASKAEVMMAPGVVLGAAVASAVVPALVEVSMDFLASAVREASKDRIASSTAISTGYLHGFPTLPADNPTALPEPSLVVNPQFGCLVVVRGTFKKVIDHDRLAAGVFPNRSAFLTAVGIAASTTASKTPDFYLAARIEFSGENSAFRLVPIDMELSNYIGNQNAEMILNVTFASARAGRDGTPLAIATLPLPRLELGTQVNSALLAGSASGWIGFPGGDPVAKAALGELQKAYDAIGAAGRAGRQATRVGNCTKTRKELAKVGGTVDNVLNLTLPDGKTGIIIEPQCSEFVLAFQRAALDAIALRPGNRSDATDRQAPVLAARIVLTELEDSVRRDEATAAKAEELTATYRGVLRERRGFTPVTIEAEIIETRKASEFMKILADVLDKSKKGVGDALVASLSPAERAKRRADEEQQTRTNRAAVATAQDAVRLRQAELDDLPATAPRAERVRGENNLRQAKIAANNAYLADGRGIPYPEAQP